MNNTDDQNSSMQDAGIFTPVFKMAGIDFPPVDESIPESDNIKWLVIRVVVGKLKNRYEKVYGETDKFNDQIEAIIQEDSTVQEWLDKAIVALKAGEIEFQSQWYQEERDLEFDIDKSRVSSVSFLLWLEKQGFVLAKEVVENSKLQIQIYFQRRQTEEFYERAFPLLPQDQFLKNAREPLWRFSKGLIYLMGKTTSQKVEEEIRFLQRERLAQKLIEYAEASIRVKKLELLGYVEGSKLMDQMQNLEVEPNNLIEWAKNLPVDIPIFQDDKSTNGSNSVAENKMEESKQNNPDSISIRQETSYLNMIGALLELLLQREIPGTGKSAFRTQDSIISEIIDRHGKVDGLSKSLLGLRFGQARNSLKGHK